ncbi:extracellular solute-binding protein [Oceanicola sp. S124]|uniref:extracellular solute-binding protein n=1 Tax=Oceanicola sp. S124 TaxID=1042378 RepID=UPI0002557A3F|nr:extracellular solute-binding protein [Oceanicola sp. S124]
MKTFVKTLTLGLTAGAIAAPAMAQELSLWSWRQEDRAVYEELIAAFEAEHPEITVTFEAFEASSYATILSTALAGDSGPDLMMVRAYGAFEAVAGANYLMPLTEADVPGLADMTAPAIAAQTLRADGKVYGVPFASQTMLVIYNKGIYEQLGLSEPQTWDELMANAKAVKDAGMYAFANGTATAWQNETIVSALTSSVVGSEFFDEIVAGTTDFTDPRYVSGLQHLQDISAYFPDGFTGLDYASSQQLFASGMAAMFAGGSFEIANFRAQNPDLEIGVFAAPGEAAEDEKLVGVFFDGGYAGNATTEHPEAVKAFLAYTATPEFGQVFANKLRNITPIAGVTLEDGLLNEIAELNRAAVPYIMLTNFRYEEPSGSVLLQAEVQKMLAGESTPEEAAEAVTSGIATYYAPFQD